MNISNKKYTYVNKQAHRGRDKYYQSKEWKRLREFVINRDKGLCQDSLRKGIVKLAGKYKTVDHIIPRSTVDIDQALKPEWMDEITFIRLKEKIRINGYDIVENLELLSKQAHDIKSAKEKHNS